MDDRIEIGTIEAVPHCSKCGSDDLRMPEGVTVQDDLTDDSLLTCEDCGTAVTYRALIEACEAHVAKNFMLGSPDDLTDEE